MAAEVAFEKARTHVLQQSRPSTEMRMAPPLASSVSKLSTSNLTGKLSPQTK